MKCREIERNLLEDVGRGDETPLADHLRVCSECRRLYLDLVALNRMVKAQRGRVEAPPGFEDRVLKRSRKRRAPTLPWKSLAYSSLMVAILALTGDRLCFWMPTESVPTARVVTPPAIDPSWRENPTAQPFRHSSALSSKELQTSTEQLTIPSLSRQRGLPSRIQIHRKQLHDDSDFVYAVH